MKVIVCSDSHGNIGNMLEMIEKERPDKLYHLGDTAQDAEQLQMTRRRLPMVWVPGNCDGWGAHGPAERVLEEDGVRIYMLHGHTAQVKVSCDIAIHKAEQAGADVLLFGHTHRPLVRREGKLLLMNPGSIRSGEYGVLTIENGGAHCRLASLWGG